MFLYSVLGQELLAEEGWNQKPTFLTSVLIFWFQCYFKVVSVEYLLFVLPFKHIVKLSYAKKKKKTNSQSSKEIIHWGFVIGIK